MGRRPSFPGMGIWFDPSVYCQHKAKHVTDQGTPYWVQCTNISVEGKQMCRQHRRELKQLELVLEL